MAIPSDFSPLQSSSNVFFSILPSREKITEFFLKNIFWISGAVVVGICFKKFCYDRLVQIEGEILEIKKNYDKISLIEKNVDLIIKKLNQFVSNKKELPDELVSEQPLTQEQQKLKVEIDKVLKQVKQARQSKKKDVEKQMEGILKEYFLEADLLLSKAIRSLSEQQSQDYQNFETVLDLYPEQEEEDLNVLKSLLDIVNPQSLSRINSVVDQK
ncbi:MAG: hypothetical protein L0207_03485 [Chlamydiae bacterium]|nr:hypothetical protein [Chlamydiota bacterium]